MDNITRRDNKMAYISDLSVFKQQLPIKILVKMYNKTTPFNLPRFALIIKAMGIKHTGKIYMEPPFRCEYGKHIQVGDNFYANSGCVMLDVGKITIGNNVMFGPEVYLFTAGHPIHPESRNSSYEYGMPITIGDNVWIGGNTVLCPGVTVGSGTVIGAGSVVTKNIPDGVIAAGNPCRVIREITDEDKPYLFKKIKFDDEAWANINKNNT